MSAVEVGTLRLRCDVKSRERTRFAIEDAMRTAIPDERRLVLLRRMQVGRAGSSHDPARRESAMRDGWLAAVADARHGGSDSAADANCVWFESRIEAESLLLSRLLAGRSADGWFWKLALPEWRGQPLRQWLGQSLRESLSRGEDDRLLAITRSCMAAGALDLIPEVLAPAGGSGGYSTGQGDAHAPEPGAREMAQASGESMVDDGGQGAAPKPLQLPGELRRMIAVLLRAGGTERAIAQAVMRAHAIRVSPALTLSPVRLAEIVSVTLRAIQSPGETAVGSGGQVPQGAPAMARRLPTGGEDMPTTSGDKPRAANRTADDGYPVVRPLDGQQPLESGTLPEPWPSQPIVAPGQKLRSRHAGLWLVVPALNWLGLREWLMARPWLLGEHPGRQLMLAIARHHRVPEGDPVLQALGSPAYPGELPEWTGLWRRGLDGWLRRHARRRLHDLVRRPGQLECGDMRVDIRFPPADADIRLRRLALDRDPGWTDWLGLSVRYHFSEETWP